MNDIITIQTKTKSHTLKKEEYARWLCLIEAIDLVERKASELKTDIISDDFWVKPLAFQKYIEQRVETMLLDIGREEFNIDIKTAVIPKFVETVTEQEEELVDEEVYQELDSTAQ
ncbi:MAG: hypothetical protein ACOYNN_16420 [Terrimicrobiaceae bacterium]|jgi:hypothetical protein